jgi:DNA-binding NarL/FixJ family response regulator
MHAKQFSTLIAEDHEITRLGIRRLVDRVGNLNVIAEFDNGQSVFEYACEHQPDLIIMDIGMPVLDGISATALIKESCASKIILLSSIGDAEVIRRGLSAGANAFCSKGINLERFRNATDSVMAGGLWIDAQVAKAALPSHATPPVVEPMLELNAADTALLRLIADGASKKHIAEVLGVPFRIVRERMHLVCYKLNVFHHTQAAVKAVRAGII